MAVKRFMFLHTLTTPPILNATSTKRENKMEFFEAHGLGISGVYKRFSKKKINKDHLLPSQELLLKQPNDPRAWHCKTVEEYRLWKYSNDYSEMIALRDNPNDIETDNDWKKYSE